MRATYSFRRELSELYADGKSPNFNTLEQPWCLFSGNSLVIVWCPGSDYTLLKDAESFAYDSYDTRLNSANQTEAYPTFRIHNELKEGSGMAPTTISNIDTKQHSFSIIYSNSTLESIYQFYEKEDSISQEASSTSENVFLRRMKSQESDASVTSFVKVWGSEHYQVVQYY